MNKTRIAGYLAYGLAFIGLSFIGIMVPIGYMIGEHQTYGRPYMVSYPLLGALVFFGLFFVFILYVYFDAWLEETRDRKGREDEDV